MYQVKKIFTLFVVVVFMHNLLIAQNAISNAYKLTGTVINAATKQPQRGIRISYKELTATITDSAGNFTINLPKNNVSILLSGDGFQDKIVAVNKQNNIKVAMYKDGFNSFANGINLPTGTVPQTLSNSAATSIDVNDGWQRFSENPDSYLQGQVAGLNVINRSGTPDIGAALFLRGINSLYATNQPLYIVDGVIFNQNVTGSIISNNITNPLSNIDIRDIDNITVIKDASTLYGSKGANGAIVITTIRAKELGTKIDFSVFGGANFAPQELPMMNAADYRIYLSEILKTKGMTDAAIQAQPYMNDNFSSGSYFAYHNNTDWQKLVLKSAASQNVYLKVTGGDNIAKYAISLGFLNNKGITSNTGLTKYNMRFNGDLNLSKKMSATTNFAFTFSEQNLRDQGNSPKTNPIFLSLVKAPFLRTNDVSATGTESPSIADRDTLNIGNPLALINNSLGLNRNYRFFASIGFNYAFSKKINLSNTTGIIYNKIRESYFIPSKGVTPDTLSNAIARDRLGSQVTSVFSIYNDTRLTYIKRINKINSFTAMVGLRYLRERAEQDFGLGYNSAIDQLVSVGNGLNALRRIGGDIGESKWLNTYINANYAYNDKLFLTASVSSDGSSRFGNNVPTAISLGQESFSLFPTISAAWIVASNAKSNLVKLRASYGLAGNDDIGNYTALQTYSTQNLLGMEGLVRSGIANNQLQWEQVKKLNFGIDIAMLKERVQLSLDIYNHQTDKLITYEPTPTASGFDYVISNSGGLKNNGIELALNARIINRKNFTWDAGVNIATNSSSITKLPASNIISSFSGATYITQVGGAPNEFFGYKTNGVYASDAAAASDGLSVRNADGSLRAFKGGDVKFADLNNDKIIDDNDRTTLGNPNPKYFGAVFTKFSYKRFSLNAYFSFTSGNKIFNFTRQQLESMSNVYNQTNNILNRWRTNGDITNTPKATWGDPMGNARFSDRWIENGDYFRLKTLTASYDLPFKDGFFKYLTIYATGNNLFTLTKYLGYDPEFSATQSIFGQGVDNLLEPQAKSVQLGFRLGL